MTIRAQRDKPLKLDAIDKKIFYYLSVDYRMPRNELAKIVKISPQRLNHRIKQLEKDILEPYLCINYPLLNIHSYLMLYDSLKEEEVKVLTEAEETYALVHLVGEYQYLTIVITDEILKFCGTCTPHAIPHIFPLTLFMPDKWNGFNISTHKESVRAHKEHLMDRKDYTILANLSANPAISLLELSERVKMSRQTIATKMKQMEQANVIQAYRFSLNVPKLGLSTYLVHLECPPNKIMDAIEIIHNDPYAGFLYQSHNHLFFWYIISDQNQLFEFLEKIGKKGRVKVSQNTGAYMINPVPDYVLKLFEERAVQK